MKLAELAGKSVVIWGTGREAMAAAALIRRGLPGQQPPVFIDDNPAALSSAVTDPAAIEAALARAGIVVKSPGISLYHPRIKALQARGVRVTSLLNLWFAEPRRARTICVTGTKGKSTTAALIAHMLDRLGQRVTLMGNIGLPAGADDTGADFAVVEMSSYQTADFDQACDLAVLTSLYPEHLDWHGSLERYYRDKLNLLAHAGQCVADAQCLTTMANLGLAESAAVVNAPSGLHVENGRLFDGAAPLPPLANPYLTRAHNLRNVCLALAALRSLGFALADALAGLEDFQGLPHRQQELGVRDGILYVDDSISTTPQSAIAAMEAYKGRPLALIAGGHDRGIDYAPLIAYLTQNAAHTVLCMGETGEKIYAALKPVRPHRLHKVPNLESAVPLAQKEISKGGVLLLSPAASSYGMFRDFIARGQAFAAASGFLYET